MRGLASARAIAFGPLERISVTPYIGISEQNVFPGGIKRLAIKFQMRLQPAGDTFKFLRGRQLCLRRADHGGDARIGACLVFPIRATVSAIGLDLVPKLCRDVSKEVALRGRNDLGIGIFPVPHVDYVGVAPMAHGDFIVMQAKEKHGVKGKIIALVLRKKKRQRPGQSEHRGRVCSRSR